MKPEETIDFPIRWAWHHISRMYNSEAAKHGGSLSHGYILLNIDIKEGTPSTSLGPLLGMEPTSLSRTIKTMEEKGLIERRACEEDGRKVFIHLTAAGENMRKSAKETVIKFNESIQDHIPSENLEIFKKTLLDINQLLSTQNIFK